jgi:hypothetical protein
VFYLKRQVNMKAIAKLGALVLCVLVAFTACDLFTGITVQWTVNVVGASSSVATIDYTAYNSGLYDLTGVNLQIAALSSTGAECGRAWTPSFSLAQGQYYYGTIYLNTSVQAYDATVLAIDMDKP